MQDGVTGGVSELRIYRSREAVRISRRLRRLARWRAPFTRSGIDALGGFEEQTQPHHPIRATATVYTITVQAACGLHIH